MENLTLLNICFNIFQYGSGFGTNNNTTTNVSARKMDSKKDGTTSTDGMAKYDGSTCNIWGQDSYISSNCPNCDIIKTLVEYTLVSKEALNVRSGQQRKEKTMGGAPTGPKRSRQLASEKQTE